MTGVTRWFLKRVEGERAGNDMTLPATQVGPRTVEAGLGGHDDGASGVDEGVENASLPLSKRDDWHGLIVPPSVIFVDK